MIFNTQTKVVVKNSKGEMVVRGNCFAACIASYLDLPITEVPNVEVLFHVDETYWLEVMLKFLESKGYLLVTDDRFKIFHLDKVEADHAIVQEWVHACKDRYYFVTGNSIRGVKHMCIYRNGELLFDPHPSRDGLLTEEIFEAMEGHPNKYKPQK